MAIYNAELSNLRDRIRYLKNQHEGKPQGQHSIAELCAICDRLLNMISDLASRRH